MASPHRLPRGSGRFTVALLTLCLAAPLAAQPSERAARERLDAIGSEIQGVSRRLTTTREAQAEASQGLRRVETALAAVSYTHLTLPTKRIV